MRINSFSVKWFYNILIFIIGMTAAFYRLLGDKLWNLNQVQLDASGDGLKNYFTFAYHYKYCDSLQFTGLLYPYGDYTLYTDSQILLVLMLQFLRSIGIESEPYLLGILNGLPIASFYIGGVIMMLILRHYNVSFWFVGILAVFIMSLSPQITRVSAHYALAYGWLVPMVWLFVIKIGQSKKRMTIGIFSLLCVFFLLVNGFLHAYLLLMGALFLTSYALIQVVNTEWKRGMIFTGISLMSVVIFYMINQHLDLEVNRPQNPYGMWAFLTKPIDLLPIAGIFHELLKSIVHIPSDNAEGYAYPSFITFIFVIISLWGLIKNKVAIRAIFNSQLNIVFFASILTLLFSMGVHLHLTGSRILEWLPPLRQFRGLGRFSWIFYYVSISCASIYLLRAVNSLKSINLRIILILAFFSILFIDSIAYLGNLGAKIEFYKSKNQLLENQLIKSMLEDHGHSANFDAVVAVPPSTEGAEKISFRPNYFLKTAILPFSYQTGIPTTLNISSRTSLTSVLSMLELFNSNYGYKDRIVNRVDSLEKLLIVCTEESKNSYANMLKKARFIGENEHISLYETSANSLLFQESILLDSSYVDLSLQSQIISQDTFLYFDNFNNENEHIGVDGRPGTRYFENGSDTLMNLDLNVDIDIEASLSFWLKIMPDSSHVPHFNVLISDGQNRIIRQETFRDWDLTRTEIYQEWMQFRRKYHLNNQVKNITLIANGRHQYLDNLLLKSDSMNAAYRLNDTTLYFNHIFGKENR